MTAVTVEALWVYPVKSLQGIPLTKAQLTCEGLQGDREWMVVDDNGRFITQRQLPKLASIKTTIIDDTICLQRADGDVRALRAGSKSTNVKVWKDHCQAFCSEEDFSPWLQEALETTRSLHLVYFQSGFKRSPKRERFGTHAAKFADAAPFLITNQQSLDALNAHLKASGENPVSMSRFRPNLVVNGIEAFDEHNVSRLEAHQSGLSFSLVDHCQRCAVITVDQNSGIRPSKTQPFSSLIAINPMPENANAPAFGVNSILLEGSGMELSVGQTFTASY